VGEAFLRKHVAGNQVSTPLLLFGSVDEHVSTILETQTSVLSHQDGCRRAALLQ